MDPKTITQIVSRRTAEFAAALIDELAGQTDYSAPLEEGEVPPQGCPFAQQPSFPPQGCPFAQQPSFPPQGCPPQQPSFPPQGCPMQPFPPQHQTTDYPSWMFGSYPCPTEQMDYPPWMLGGKPYPAPAFRPRPGAREKEQALRTAGKEFATRCCDDDVDSGIVIVDVTGTIEVDGYVFTTLQFARNYAKKFSRRIGNHYRDLGYKVVSADIEEDATQFHIVLEPHDAT